MSHTTPDPSANGCPLCSQPNQCAMAQDPQATACWCMHANVDPAALARLPGPERGRRCICPACARAPDGGRGTTAPL
ncbi:MAG: cysteine-rich CWC family protein [Simplicispira sp.]|nr:cysteine-rich CWC family protein [Simplicispira sp.]